MSKGYWLDEWRKRNLMIQLENEIIQKTGLNKDELRKMDIGDIEKKLNIVAKSPYKKRNLYRFVSLETIKKQEETVTKALSEQIQVTSLGTLTRQEMK